MRINIILVGVIFILFLQCSDSRADDTQQYLYLGAWSKHMNSNYDYNSNHGLIGYERNGWGVATFKNSYYNRSVLLGYTFHYELTPWLEVGAQLGAVTGYRNHLSTVGAWAPVVIPTATIKWGRFGVDFHVVPEEFTSIGFRVQL